MSLEKQISERERESKEEMNSILVWACGAHRNGKYLCGTSSNGQEGFASPRHKIKGHLHVYMIGQPISYQKAKRYISVWGYCDFIICQKKIKKI